MLRLIIFASALAQNCDDTNFSACLDLGEQYLETTCGSLQQNATTYAQCLCYQKVADGNCYGMCPNNSTIQAEFATVSSSIVSICAAANLDPKNLVYPAPWAPQVSAPTAMPTTGSTGTTTGSTVVSPSARNSGMTLGFEALIALGIVWGLL